MGLVHVGAHTNTADKTLGEKVYHRTAFCRSVDEGLLDCKRVVQIGIRGSSVTLDPYRYSRNQVMDWRSSSLPQSLFSIVKEGLHRGFTQVPKVGLGLDVAIFKDQEFNLIPSFILRSWLAWVTQNQKWAGMMLASKSGGLSWSPGSHTVEGKTRLWKPVPWPPTSTHMPHIR